MRDLNKVIEDSFIRGIVDARTFVTVTSLRESVENWKDNLLKITEEIKLQNNPEKDWVIEHNLSTINLYYNQFQEALKDEKQHQKVIEEMIAYFDALNHDDITNDLRSQLLVALPELKLKEEYGSLHGLFFEYDSHPVFGIIAFPE